MEVKQKWVKENGVFYPIPGDTTLHVTPGTGVFQIYEEKSMGGSRLGLRKMADKFTFNFKIYDLGVEDTMQKIQYTWNSDAFVSGNKNLGIIFNGLKSTRKTIASKILSNRMNMPVVIVNAAYDGLLNFIQSLCFECVVLIDEAEKSFQGNGDVLLKMIDGVYNEARKLYLLTTNRLSIDERYPMLIKDQDTRAGLILEQPDADGFFTVRNSWSDNEELCCIVSYHDAPSLYRGGLQMFCV